MNTESPGRRRSGGDYLGVTSGLTELAALLLSVEDVEQALGHLARIAVLVIPDGPSCGITLAKDGYFTVVYAGSVPASVDEEQYSLGDGPGLEAIRTRSPVVVQDLAGEDRWGQWPAAALAAGAHGVYAHPLEVGEELVGVLSLYADQPNLFPEPVRRVAVEFAEPAALLLTGVLRRLSQEEVIAQLHAALSSRAVIDQAIGITMAAHRCGAEEALAVLRRLSNERNIKLRELAANLVHSAAESHPASGDE